MARPDKGGWDVGGGSGWWRKTSVKVGRRLCLLMLRFVGVVWEGNPLWGTEAIRLLRAMFMVDKREGVCECVDNLITQAPKSVLTQLTKILLKPKTNVNVKNRVKNTDA